MEWGYGMSHGRFSRFMGISDRLDTKRGQEGNRRGALEFTHIYPVFDPILFSDVGDCPQS